MKRIILLLSILLLLTSCDIKYDIKINKNELIIDKLSVTEMYDDYNENKIEEYDDFIKDIGSSINIEEEYDEDKAYYNSTFRNNYKSIDEYKNNYYIKKYIGDITNNCETTCELRLTFNSNFKDKMFGNETYLPQIDSLDIELEFPFTIIETNAQINKKTLTWNITQDDNIDYLFIKYKNLTINDNNKLIFYILSIIVTIIFILVIFFGIIKKQKNSVI